MASLTSVRQISTCQDISPERRDISPEQLAELISHTADVLMIYDELGLLQWASPSLRRIFGWRPEDALGRPFYLSHTESDDPAQSVWNDWCAVASNSWLQRRQTLTATGRPIWIEEAVTMLRHPDGKTAGAVVSARDVTAQVHAVGAMTEASEFYRSVAQSVADVAYRTDALGIVTWISDGVQGALGVDSDEVLERPIQRLAVPMDIPLLETALEGARAGEPRRARVRVRHPDGDTRWWDVSARPVVDPDGEIVGVAGAWHDADAEVKSLRVRDSAETQLRAVAESAGDWTLALNRDGVITWASSAARMQLGRDGSDLIGSHVGLLVDSASMPSFSRTLGDGVRADFNAALLRADGRWASAHVVCRPVPARGVEVEGWIVNAHVAGSTTGTLRGRAADAERATVRVRKGVVQWASPGLTSMLGWLPEDWVGNQLTDFIAEGDTPGVCRAVAEEAEDIGEGLRCQAVSLDGGIRPIELKSTRMRRHDGQVTHVVVVMQSAGVVPVKASGAPLE